MAATSNPPRDEQEQETTPNALAEGHEQLPTQPPSMEIAAQGGNLPLADQPGDVDSAIAAGEGQGDEPSLPQVAAPYQDEAEAAGTTAFNPLVGEQTTPLPEIEAGEPSEQTVPLPELAADAPHEEQTAPLPPIVPDEEAGERKAAAVTSPLAEEQLPDEQPRGDLTPLERDTLVDGRYAITNVVQSQPQGEEAYIIYRVVDERSAEQCWVCGSRENNAGEMYCAECGAQLANKVYWLRETWANGAEGSSGAALMLGKGLGQTQGFARIFRSFRENERDYLLTEEGAGQPLTSYAPLDPSGEPVGEERLLGWAASLAAALRPLHEAGLVLGRLPSAAISVIGGELPRITDVSAVREADENTRQHDVQQLADTLSAFLGQPLDASAATKSGEPDSLSELLAQAVAGNYKDAGAFTEAVEKYREEGMTPATLSILASCGSDVGMVRKLNEDSVLLLNFNAVETSHTQPFALLVVADGMGGHDSGEVASSMAIREIAASVAQSVLGRAIFNYGATVSMAMPEGEVDVMAGGEAVGEMLREAVEAANKAIVQQGRARHSDMGTTCVAALVLGNRAWFANVGDSRGYLYRDGQLEQITEDHSLAWRLVQAGQLAREDIRTFERRNEIYRSLGDDFRTEIDLFSVRLKPYDVILLCSDGLWEMVNEVDVNGKPGIASILEHSDDPHSAVQKLLKAANAGGGEDNIGVVVAQMLVSGDTEADK